MPRTVPFETLTDLESNKDWQITRKEEQMMWNIPGEDPEFHNRNIVDFGKKLVRDFARWEDRRRKFVRREELRNVISANLNPTVYLIY